MVSPAEEKRQEEKRIKELRDFQRASPANRRCFDCNEMMPQYICLDFNTFVCTSCSGIHREFAHRVKSISMSKFTESEVKTMIKLGGNDAAQKYWRAKHDPSFRPQGGTDGERTRNFIRLTYIDRKWVYESPRASKKDDPPQKTASASSKSRNTSFTTSNDDEFFGSSSSKKKAAAVPAFDAFGNDSSSASGGGFAQFGDFSNFANDSSAKASNDFGDFGHFDQPSSTTSSASGFGDFGDFEGSSGSSAPAAATSAPAVRHDFGSFKLAPPPGASFSSSSSGVAAPVATTPPVQQKKPQNDFMAFSPDKAVKDPFGFDDPPASNTSSHSASTTFDAFAAPAPPPSTGSRASSSSFDAFGSSTTPAATPSVFDAFGSPVKKTNSSSSGFDAFGASSSSTATSSAFDAFGASTASTASFDAFGATPAAAASPFDAFGGSSTGAASNGGFGDFSSATPGRSSSGTRPSTTVSDPFSAFSPRASSGSSLAPEPAKAESVAAADPFAAFDGMDAPTTSGPSATSSGIFGAGTTDVFGASGTQSTPGNGLAGSSGLGFGGSGQPMAVNNDPFAFAGSSGSKSNSFSNTNGAPGFQGQGAGVMGMNPYQQHYSQQGAGAPNGNPMYPNMHMQQQVPYQQGFQHPQQQQWYGQPQQHQPGQQYPQHPGQFPHSATPNNGGVPPPVPVHAKPAVDASSINDPFASLNIGLSSSGSGNASASNSRGNSFTQKPGSASGSFSNGQPHGAATAPPLQPQQNAFGGGFPPAAQGGSRGNSFEQTPAFNTPMQKNASPMSSFSYPQPQASFGGPSQSPMSSFTASTQQAPFADNAFGTFTSAPRADSLNKPASNASANPFDMF